jgi:hypothetical protein
MTDDALSKETKEDMLKKFEQIQNDANEDNSKYLLFVNEL